MDLSPLVAGIVVFHSDAAQVSKLAETVLTEADHLIVFLNSDIDPELRARWASEPRISLVGTTENLGIGVGLNGIAAEAFRMGAGGIVLFDQDSQPPPGMLGRLREAWRELEAAGRSPGVVSPLLVAAPGAASKPPRYRFHADDTVRGSLRPAAFVPTSGSLISADVLRRVGLFRADYFIDGIDLEWSFRAASFGYGSWVETACRMPHSIGTGTIGSRRLGWRMPKQKPFRMYCVVRNTLYGLRLRHIPLAWKLRQVAYLPLQIGTYIFHHRFRRPIVRLMLRGLGDGVMGRLGPPREWPD